MGNLEPYRTEKKRNSSETRSDSLRSPNRFQILARANTENCNKLIANKSVNTQSTNTLQKHPPQILENTPSSPAAKERPATSEPTGIIFGKIIASIEKVLKTTKSFSKK